MLIFLFTFSCSVWSKTLTVVVDPGHGGKDQGTHKAGVIEADITLKVATLLNRRLKQDRQFNSQMTRIGDQHLTLMERARIAKRNRADLLLSIHVNSNPDARARGAEFYFQNQLPSDEESMYLAHLENAQEVTGEKLNYEYLEKNKFPADVTAIVSDLLSGSRIWRSSQLAQTLKSHWGGTRKTKSANSVRQAPFFVLSQVTVPSALVELGFLTNVEDLAELTNDAQLEKMAEDLYRGLKAYKELLDKES